MTITKPAVTTAIPIVIKSSAKRKVITQPVPALDVKSVLVSPVTYPKGVPFSYTVTTVRKPVLSANPSIDELKKLVEDRFVDIIKETNGNEWQSKFSWIAARKFPGVFKEMPPFAEDGGNDGWLPGHGIYFQCYGPFKSAREQIRDFIKKIFKDTPKIIKNWDDKEKVKEYHFVWNTKFDTSISVPLLKAVNDAFAALMKRYGIKIELITAETLLEAFRTLTFEQQLEFVNWDSLSGILTSLVKQ